MPETGHMPEDGHFILSVLTGVGVAFVSGHYSQSAAAAIGWGILSAIAMYIAVAAWNYIA